MLQTLHSMRDSLLSTTEENNWFLLRMCISFGSMSLYSLYSLTCPLLLTCTWCTPPSLQSCNLNSLMCTPWRQQTKAKMPRQRSRWILAILRSNRLQCPGLLAAHALMLGAQQKSDSGPKSSSISPRPWQNTRRNSQVVWRMSQSQSGHWDQSGEWGDISHDCPKFSGAMLTLFGVEWEWHKQGGTDWESEDSLSTHNKERPRISIGKFSETPPSGRLMLEWTRNSWVDWLNWSKCWRDMAKYRQQRQHKWEWDCHTWNGNKKAKGLEKIEKKARKNRSALADYAALIAIALNWRVAAMDTVAKIQLFQVDLTNNVILASKEASGKVSTPWPNLGVATSMGGGTSQHKNCLGRLQQCGFAREQCELAGEHSPCCCGSTCSRVLLMPSTHIIRFSMWGTHISITMWMTYLTMSMSFR